MHRLAHVVLVSTIVSLLATPARAQDPDGARLYNEGYRLYKEKQYSEACPLLERSLAASPKIRTRGALALCYEATGRVASAYTTWRAVGQQAQEAGAVEAPSLRRANEKTRELEARVTRMVFQVASPPAGLQVQLDGRPLAASELGVPVLVDPGDHTLEAKAPDRADWRSSFQIGTVDAGKTRSVPIGPLLPIERVEKIETPQPTTEQPRVPVTPADRSEPMPTLKYVGLATAGAGVVSIAVGTIFALSAKSKWNDAKDQRCDDNGVCPTQAGADLVNDAGSKATKGTIFIGAGIALAAGGVAMFLLAPKSKPALRPEVSIGPGGAQLGVKGSF